MVDYTAELILAELALLVLSTLVFGPMIYILYKSAKSKRKMADVLRKYDTIDHTRITTDTINQFHKELHECFASDKAYLDYIQNLNVSFEIERIDKILLHYSHVNNEQD